jgi:hypothetical protein
LSRLPGGQNSVLDEIDPDFLTVVVGREQVEAGDTAEIVAVLQSVLGPETARKFFERVDIAFSGYDHDPRELYEIVEVREFVHKLDEQFPYWLYFLTKQGNGLRLIFFCFCPPYLKPEAQQEIWSQRMNSYLLNRGFPAMATICEFVGWSHEQTMELNDRVVEYLSSGWPRW